MGLVAAAAVLTGVGVVVASVTSGGLWIFFAFGGTRLV